MGSINHKSSMLKSLWRKMKQNHLLLMIVCCLVPAVLIVGFLSFFKGSNYWSWLVILLCPLMHIFMMSGHAHDDRCNHKVTKEVKLYKCPECGLEYQEKEWVKKCEAWCKKHKSCNLEITKHSIKI